jgi:hypothetical protein
MRIQTIFTFLLCMSLLPMGSQAEQQAQTTLKQQVSKQQQDYKQPQHNRYQAPKSQQPTKRLARPAPITKQHRPRHDHARNHNSRTDHRYDRHRRHNRRHNERYDNHYNDDHSRHTVGHQIGHILHSLPLGFIRLLVDSDDYYYHSGVFYQPSGQRYVVVNLTVGSVLHTLPSGYSKRWVNGQLHYVLGDAYLRRHTSGYVVVTNPYVQPVIAAPVVIAPPVRTGELYIYPRLGQDQAQQDRDRYECHRWGVEQTGFDPSINTANYSRSAAYKRAKTACLEARNYTVR